MRLYRAVAISPCDIGKSGFEATCPDCDLKSALDHTTRFVISYLKFELRDHSS